MRSSTLAALLMIAMTTRLRLLCCLLALFAVLGLGVLAASALPDWLPGANGLPPDIAAIQHPSGEH